MGGCVDFFKDPSNKDTSGWHGSATMCDIYRISEGEVEVLWQVRRQTIRLPGVHCALIICALLAGVHENQYAELPLQNRK
eukprot:13646524-Heterocapsa_arctica.AAC.1